MKDCYEICSTDEIAENSAKGFSIETADGTLLFFIVNKRRHFYGYLNRCPHTGVNLEWKPDQFLDLDRERIQCSTHGAKFRIENGYCDYGPCLGQYLEPVELIIDMNRICLKLKQRG